MEKLTNNNHEAHNPEITKADIAGLSYQIAQVQRTLAAILRELQRARG